MRTTVLLVEPDADLATTLATTLRHAGYAVALAPDAVAAAARLRTGPPPEPLVELVGRLMQSRREPLRRAM